MRNDFLHPALLMLLGALTGCRGGGGNASNDAVPAPSAQSAGPVQTDTLTGLYEGGTGPRRNQICMIQRDGGRTSFGLVSWGNGDTSCSGFGTATRAGDRLRLAMAGDEACRIDARIDGRRVTLPDALPQGCAYYCGPNARMTGAAFDKVGGAEADAMRAVDLVGDSLCGG